MKGEIFLFNSDKSKKKNKDINVQQVVKEIAAQYDNTEIDENSTIIFHDYNDMAVAVYAKKPEKVNNVYISEMIFAISHDYFDEPIIENLAGIGIDPESALMSGAHMLVDGMLGSVISGLNADDSSRIMTQIMGQMHIFRRASEYSTLGAGVSEPNMDDMFSLIEDEIPHYLGTKKAYWLELFASVSKGEYICEARLNNIVYPELTQILYKYAKSWKTKDDFHSEKQTFLFVQEEATYMPCDITKERVANLVLQSIELFKQVHDADTRNRALNTVKMLAKDDTLAFEMCVFLPEIYTQKVLSLKESDGLVAVKGEKKYPICKSQLRTYGYIEDIVEKYLHKNHPTKEDNMKIMALSSKMKSVTEAVQNGAKLEDLIIPPMAFFIDDNYEVR